MCMYLEDRFQMSPFCYLPNASVSERADSEQISVKYMYQAPKKPRVYCVVNLSVNPGFFVVLKYHVYQCLVCILYLVCTVKNLKHTYRSVNSSSRWLRARFVTISCVTLAALRLQQNQVFLHQYSSHKVLRYWYLLVTSVLSVSHL